MKRDDWADTRPYKVSGPRSKPSLYFFGWPSFLGGADTKLAHLCLLLHEAFPITVIPNDARHLHDKKWTQFLSRLGIGFCSLDQLPEKLNGFALSLCNTRFFTEGIVRRAREKGLKVIWSSEMMWHHEGELAAVQEGLVDTVLYVSESQKRVLSKGYGRVRSLITGNYVDPGEFPFIERDHETFTIGRLSRADPLKYPEDFPVFYEALDLPGVRFRVMAWSKALARKYRWHHFDSRWNLLQSQGESQVRFLHSLDLFIYPLGHHFKETWGRSTVEAMLTGCIPLVSPGDHLENLLVHGESGFVCRDFLEYQGPAQRLCRDRAYRRRMARQCREHALNQLCDKAEHRQIWRRVFQ